MRQELRRWEWQRVKREAWFPWVWQSAGATAVVAEIVVAVKQKPWVRVTIAAAVAVLIVEQKLVAQRASTS